MTNSLDHQLASPSAVAREERKPKDGWGVLVLLTHLTRNREERRQKKGKERKSECVEDSSN